MPRPLRADLELTIFIGWQGHLPGHAQPKTALSRQQLSIASNPTRSQGCSCMHAKVWVPYQRGHNRYHLAPQIL